MRFDSVFTPVIEFSTSDHPFANDKPILSERYITDPLNKLEDEFVARMRTILSAEGDALVAKLKLAGDSLEDINKTKWNLAPRLQQLLWYLWSDGWKLGKEHSLKELKMMGYFSSHLDLTEFAQFTDSNQDSQPPKKISLIRLRDRDAVVDDAGIPLDHSYMKTAIENRTVQLAKDVDEKGEEEIKQAFREFAVKDANGKTISKEQLEQRINKVLDKQGASKKTMTGGNRANLIARTELSGAYTTARLDSYVAAGVKRVRWLTLEDLNVCRKCSSRHGLIFELSNTAAIAANPIPLHPHCRCLWQAVHEDENDEPPEPDRDPSNPGTAKKIAAIAGGWIFGTAMRQAGKELQKRVESISEAKRVKEAEQKKIMRNLFIAGTGALSLAALYLLVLKQGETQEKTKEIVGEVIKNKAKALASKAENIRAALPPATPESTGTLPSTSTSISPATPDLSNINIGAMKPSQLKALGLSDRQLQALNKYIKKNPGQINTLEDLKKIPSIGDATIDKIIQEQKRISQPLIINNQDIHTMNIRELKQSLGLSQNQALSVLNYIRKGGKISTLNDLERVPGISKATVQKTISKKYIDVAPDINTWSNNPTFVKELSNKLGINQRLAQVILNERDANGEFSGIDDLTKRVQKRLRNTQPGQGAKLALGKKTIQKISQNAVISRPGDIVEKGTQPLAPITQKPLKQLPAKRQSITEPVELVPIEATKKGFAPARPLVLPLPQTQPGKPTLSLADIRDNAKISALSRDIQAFNTKSVPIPSKLRQNVSLKINKATKLYNQQSQVYSDAIQQVSSQISKIPDIAKQVESLEQAYRTGGEIAKNRQQSLYDIQKVDGILANISAKLDNTDLITSSIDQLESTRSQLESRPDIQAYQEEYQQLVDRANELGSNELKGAIADNLLTSKINQKITDLQKLSETINADPSNIKKTIANSQAELEELRKRIEESQVARKTAIDTYTSQKAALQKEIETSSQELKQAEKALNKRIALNSRASKPQPVSNLQADRDRLRDKLQKLNADLENLNKNKGFKAFPKKLIKFTLGSIPRKR